VSLSIEQVPSVGTLVLAWEKRSALGRSEVFCEYFKVLSKA